MLILIFHVVAVTFAPTIFNSFLSETFLLDKYNCLTLARVKSRSRALIGKD